MKKIIALILALVMLGSVSVFAKMETPEVRLDTKYFGETNATKLDTPKTELWLQVDASGQIDVTVPLVLVFKTNIDGGAAQTAEAYGITNNSSADLVVTDLKVDVNQKSVTDADTDNPMTLVEYATTGLEEDTYGVKMTIAKQKDFNGTERGEWNYDLRGDILLTDDALVATKHVDANKGGLFLLPKAAANDTANGKETLIDVQMSTGELSFITKRTDDDSAIDSSKGVYLLQITYTVAIDTMGTIGEDITTAAPGKAATTP